MIKIIFLILFSGLIFAQNITAARFDSLLFDGAGGYNHYDNTLREECNLKVVKVKGKVWGNILKKSIEKACGNENETIYTIKYDLLKEGDIVVSEGILKTEDFSQLEIELSDGKNIWLGPNTEFKVGKDYCLGNGRAELYSGSIHISGGTESKTFVSTPKGYIQITHTEFSVEVKIENNVSIDILRVYEGSVNFKLNLENKENIKSSEDKAGNIEKLLQDYQNGKISIEEFSKKSLEMQKDMSQTTVTINAGFESKITEPGIAPSEPIPFETNENLWWTN